MEHNNGNCYRICRQVAGLTQERWAENLGVSVDSVRLYESGRGLPSDEVVDMMISITGYTILGWQHMRNKSSLAANMLPELEQVSLSQAVIRLLNAMRGLRSSLDAMLIIAQDDEVSEQESDEFDSIVADLDVVVEAALLLKTARGGRK